LFAVYRVSVIEDHLTSLWNRPVRGERGPQGELTREQIAAAAIALADADGLRAVTMRGVGHSLGTSAAGLYRYVRSRQELLALMVDAALGELAYPAVNGDWSRQLLAVAHEQRRAYHAHPWLLAASVDAGMLGPNALAYFDRCLAILAGVPASSAAKMEALAMLTGVVSLFARPAPASDPAALFSALDPQAHPTLAATLREPPDSPQPAERHPPEDPPYDAGLSHPSADLFDRVILSVLHGLLGAPTASAEHSAGFSSP
jgi:AcrR family transcriptional regulator